MTFFGGIAVTQLSSCRRSSLVSFSCNFYVGHCCCWLQLYDILHWYWMFCSGLSNVQWILSTEHCDKGWTVQPLSCCKLTFSSEWKPKHFPVSPPNSGHTKNSTVCNISIAGTMKIWSRSKVSQVTSDLLVLSPIKVWTFYGLDWFLTRLSAIITPPCRTSWGWKKIPQITLHKCCILPPILSF